MFFYFFVPRGNVDAGELIALMTVPTVLLPGIGQTLELGVGGRKRRLDCLWAPELNLGVSCICS